jgi:hypothetical protein
MKGVGLHLRAILIASVLLLGGCGGLFCFQVSGPITQWDYHISPFQKIRVYNSPQIYINQGVTQSVVVESEENMFHALQFHIDPFAKLLYIDFDETCIDDIDHFKIFITVDTLKVVDLRQGGEVWVEDIMKTDSLFILISGDAEVNVANLMTEEVFVNISGSGEVRLTALDTIENMNCNFSGIGSYFGYDAVCRNAVVDVSGAGLIQTTVSQNLEVNVSGQADVYYRGYPTIIENISGTGQVIDAN